jgi:hypothetical protein
VPLPNGVQLRLLVILVLAGLVTNVAHAQSVGPSQPDSVLRRILVRVEADMQEDGYHRTRVVSRAAGRFQGHELLVRGDTVVVMDFGSQRAIALADIDSVWVRRDAGRTLALVFGGLCAIVGGGVAGSIATGPDSGSGSPLPAIAFAAAVGGAICGAAGWLVGSLVQTWELEYPVPLESST